MVMKSIRNLKLKNRFFLAPMLEPNDIAFRLLCKKAGCGLTYTGMTSPLSKKKLILDDKPAVQIFGNSEKGVAEFIKKYDNRVSFWDFNLGCPSKLSKKLSHGAFLHKDFETIETILKTMKKSTKKPISIKLRKSPHAIELACRTQNLVDAVGIHPRTFKEGYSGNADYDFALKLKNAIEIPVIYSGDVNLENAGKILKDFDYVFVGRSAIGNPGIFSQLANKNVSVGFSDYLKLAERYKLFFRQIKYQAINFTKGLKNAKFLRRCIINSKTVNDIIKVMKC
ncbi:MAG: tRNA-dihydrouridine synthase family protein [archaeon]